MNDEYERLKSKLNIIIVYIDEAHAIDVWPIGESAGVINYKHRSIEDRKKCASNMIKGAQLKIPVFLDNMQNELLDLFSCWPIRCFIIENNILKYISEPNNAEFDIQDLYSYIDNNVMN